MIKPIIYIVALASLIGSGFIIYDKGGDARENKIRAEIAESNANSLLDTQKEIADENRNLQITEDQINSSPKSDDDSIGPILRDQLERMFLKYQK